MVSEHQLLMTKYGMARVPHPQVLPKSIKLLHKIMKEAIYSSDQQCPNLPIITHELNDYNYIQ